MSMVVVIQTANSNNKMKLLREMYSNQFAEYIGIIKNRGKLSNLSNTKEITEHRNDLLKNAEFIFIGKSQINTVYFKQELKQFKHELCLAFDSLEKSFYSLVIKDNIK